MVRPDSTLPSISLRTATACVVVVGWRFVEGAETTTLVTGAGMTVIVTLPLLPSLDAVIVAVPSPVLCTSPLASTVATAPFDVDHAIARLFSTVPLPSRRVAVDSDVLPRLSVVAAVVTPTLATGKLVTMVTVYVALPLLPSLDAAITAVPEASAVTTPS